MGRKWLISLIVISLIAFFIFLYFMHVIVQQIGYVIGSLVGLVVIYTILTQTALGFFKRRSQACALVLVILALPILTYAIVGVRIPQTSQFESYDVELKCQDGTPVWFHIVWNFSTEGVFSAENPFHVHAVISRANISDLTIHLAAISLAKAYSYNKTYDC